jgi:hypothetical protein
MYLNTKCLKHLTYSLYTFSCVLKAAVPKNQFLNDLKRLSTLFDDKG